MTVTENDVHLFLLRGTPRHTWENLLVINALLFLEQRERKKYVAIESERRESNSSFGIYEGEKGGHK